MCGKTLYWNILFICEKPFFFELLTLLQTCDGHTCPYMLYSSHSPYQKNISVTVYRTILQNQHGIVEEILQTSLSLQQ